MESLKPTGLWKHKDKNGNTYLSGALSGITQMMVMTNAYKRNDKDPDYFVYIRESKKKEGAMPQSNNDDL